MSEWQEVKIDDLKAPEKGSIAMGPFGSRIKAENFVSQGIPVIKGGNLNGDFILEDSYSFLTEEKADELSSANAFRRDIVITHRGTIGQVGIIPDDSKFERYIVSQSQLKVSIDQAKANPYFIYYFLRSPIGQNRLLQNASQVGVPAIAQASTSVKAILVPFPKKPIQDKIVEILLNLDHKIENNRRMNETLEGMAQAIFKSWFVDFDPVRAKVEVLESGGSEDDARLAAMQAISGKSPEDLARLKAEAPEHYAALAATADAFPSAFTTSPLGDIPEGWEVKRIEDAINRLSVGKKFSSKTASPTGKIPILDQGKSGLIGFHDEEPGVKASPEDPVIVFANHTCYMRLIMNDFSAIQNVLPFKPKDTHILWLYYATQGKQSFVEYKGHWPDFAIKEIVIPNNSLDEIYAQYIAPTVKHIFGNDLENQSLAETRDVLLPKLLSGEIDVSALNEIEDGQHA